MSDPRAKDLRATVFFIVAALLGVVAIFVGEPGRRSIGGLALGPMLLGYAWYGLSKGRFPELSKSDRKVSPVHFWLVFGVFVFVGVVLLIIGIEALGRN